MLTVHGIETLEKIYLHTYFPTFVATALTVYGIETFQISSSVRLVLYSKVATALTVYGIETGLLKLGDTGYL